jgi:hypothetical protein
MEKAHLWAAPGVNSLALAEFRGQGFSLDSQTLSRQTFRHHLATNGTNWEVVFLQDTGHSAGAGNVYLFILEQTLLVSIIKPI